MGYIQDTVIGAFTGRLKTGDSVPLVAVVNPDGTPVSAGGGSGVATGSTGKDYSGNTLMLPPTGMVLLATIPANQSRFYCEVQNQSAGKVRVVRDDGAGAQVSQIILSGGGADEQGGGWASTTFRGRIRVYGASGAQISAFED